MALPAHLAKYDGLLDLLVEQLVREAKESANKNSASRDHPPEKALPAATENKGGVHS